MAMLNFKYGLHSGLDQVAYNEGTIYVTSDEKAMYADLGGSRIRLGQIVSIPTVAEWEALKPPYSTEAFYYIVDANALLKYNGTDWIQINSTAEIREILTSLGFLGKLSALPTQGVSNGNICTVGSQSYIYKNNKWEEFTSIGANLIDLGNRVVSLENLNNGTQLTTIKKNIDDLELVTHFLGERDSLPTSGNEGEVIIVGGKVYTWVYDASYKTTTINGKETKEYSPGWVEGDESLRIEALKKKVALMDGKTTAALDGLTAEVARIAAPIDNKDFVLRDGSLGLTGNWDINDEGSTNYKITGLIDPTADADAARKGYVDKQISDKAKELLGTKTTKENTILSVRYDLDTHIDGVSNVINNAILKDGSVAMEKDLNLNGNKITYLAAPVADSDAARKKDVDTVLGTSSDSTTKETVHGAINLAKSILGTTDDAETVKTVHGVSNKLENFIKVTYKNDLDAQATENNKAFYRDGSRAMEGNINMGANQIVNLANPANNNDAANKIYVDNTTDTKITDLHKTISGVDGTTPWKGKTLKEVSGTADQNKADINTLTNTVNNLKKDLTDKIQESDAMKYRGTVEEVDDLPSTKVSIGDTYKATKEFELNGVKVRIGDLLIANGIEDQDPNSDNFGYIITDLHWDHVPSGYVAEYVPAMTVANGTVNDNQVIVSLTSAHSTSAGSGDLGIINFKAETNSAITVNATDSSVDKNGTITIGLAWGTF